MTACLRSPNALLVLLVWSSVVSASFARKPEPAPEKERTPPKSDPRYDIHKVKKGETLWSVAMDYHTSAGEIMDLNDLDSSRIAAGQNLKIPRPGANGGAPVIRQKTHVVGEDETLRGIGKKYGISEDAILRANPDVNPRRLRPGTRLTIPSGNPQPTGKNLDTPPKGAESPSTVHVVRDNDTFTSIARQYHISVTDVMTANPGVDPQKLHEGMKVKIPGARSGNKDSTAPKKSTYIVQPGDSLEKISRREGVSVGALMAANRLENPHSIAVGSELIIPGRRSSPVMASNDPPRRQVSMQAAPRSAMDPYGPPVRNDPPKQRTVTSNKTVAPDRSMVVQSSKPTNLAAKRPAQQAPPAGAVEFSYEKQAVITKPNYQPQASPATKYGAGERVKQHTVVAGETVESIAGYHNVSANRIRDYNYLGTNTKLRPGDEIMIPVSSSVASR